jgi:hypothetical protein
MMPRYLYIDCEGRFSCWSSDEPTAEDLSGADVGLVAIVRLADCRMYRWGEWTAIPEATLKRVPLEGELAPPAHWPAFG